MAARLRATRSKGTHHPAQPISPVAGPEGVAVVRDALNKDLFDGSIKSDADVVLLHCTIITSYIRSALLLDWPETHNSDAKSAIVRAGSAPKIKFL